MTVDGLRGDGPGFIHLRVRSAYSLLEGALRFPRLVSLAREHAMPAVALTDTNNLFGALEFSETMAAAGIQPIIGCTLAVDFADGVVAGRRAGEAARLPSIALLAKSEAGYANLMRLSSAAFLEVAGAAIPHVTIDRLRAHGEGLIALTGGVQGPIGDALRQRRDEVAGARLAALRDIFADRLYVELQRHGLPEEVETEPPMIDLAYEMGLPLVATNDAHFVGPDDYEAHDALICIAEGVVVAAEDRRRLTPEHWFKPAAAMAELFSDLPEAIASTVEIARRCAARPMLREPILPAFGAAGGGAGDEAEELRREARAGLEVKLRTVGPSAGFTEDDYRQRLEHELGIIISMEYPGYFLIVAEIIKWSKAHGIPVGPGRGSGAASVVAWALTITDLDPLRFNLVFERFLNPHRVSMPDFDIDFCPDRREEVIGHIRDTYGADRVAQIITFGKLQARAVLRDVGRVLQMPYGQVDRLCKLVPNNPANPVTLAQAVAGEPRLQEARAEDETVARLLEIGGALEGLYRHASTHAAGVVIGDRPLVELVPLYRDPRSDMLVTQFNMKWVEKAGLVKFDILGLKTLTVLEATKRLVEADGERKVDLERLPLDEPSTYAMLARGETLGVFQFESAGMRDLLVKAEPTNFEDLIALVALFRPGPMENIPKYLACKHGQEQPEQLHELIEPVVADTYGVIIYQEQVLQIAQRLAGFSLGEADLLRRAMGKKIKSEMDAQRARFIDGAAERGVDRERAKYIFDLVDKFAGYGFNKAHSAAYALVAYQTAYLKANFPVEFLAASMTLDMGNTDKLALFREEAARMGFKVLPPSINASRAEFAVEEGGIRYALAALRNVGRQAVEQIVAERDRGGPFRSLGDFAARIDAQLVNRRALESLVRAGAFDDLEPDRASVFAGIDRILLEAQRTASDRRSGQDDLFGGGEATRPTIDLPAAEPWDPMRRLNEEFEAIGSYLSGHPLDGYQQALAGADVTPWRKFEVLVLEHGYTAGRLAGTVTSRRERRGRSGNRYAFVGFSDPTGQFEAIVFSDVLAEAGDALETGSAAVLRVEADVEGERVRLRVVGASRLDASLAPDAAAVRVFVRDTGPLEALAQQLAEAGDDAVSIVLIDRDRSREIELRLARRYRVGERIAGSLKAIPGVVAIERTPLAAAREPDRPRLSKAG